MKKTLLIGKSGSGKTTLIQRLENKTIEYRKTQMVEHHLNFIDTPGEYLELRNMYRALIVTSADAEIIGLIQECGNDNVWIPPAFASSFSKDVIGIVTKADLAKSQSDIDLPSEVLKRAGVSRIFVVSAFNDTGIESFLEYLE